MATRRAERRKRILVNRLARKSKHFANRYSKFLDLHKVVIPCSTEEGWAWNEKDDCLVDKGGPVALTRMSRRTMREEQEGLQDENMSELRRCIPILFNPNRDSRSPIVRIWPEDIVKLNWCGEFVSWESIRHRVKYGLKEE